MSSTHRLNSASFLAKLTSIRTGNYSSLYIAFVFFFARYLKKYDPFAARTIMNKNILPETFAALPL